MDEEKQWQTMSTSSPNQNHSSFWMAMLKWRGKKTECIGWFAGGSNFYGEGATHTKYVIVRVITSKIIMGKLLSLCVQDNRWQHFRTYHRISHCEGPVSDCVVQDQCFVWKENVMKLAGSTPPSASACKAKKPLRNEQMHHLEEGGQRA